MLIAKLNGGKREALILGLTEKNIAKMKDGQPLVVSERTNAPPGSMPHPAYEIVIITGKDELEMKAMFERYGLIGPETKVTVDPRL